MSMSWRTRAALGFVAGAAFVGLAVVVAFSPSANQYNPAEVASAALDALSHQYDAVTAGTSSTSVASAIASNPRFTGAAADAMATMIAQQRANAAAGEVYPGTSQFSNVKILGMSGSSNSVKVDLQAHERLTNLQNGKAVGPSESEMVYHLVLDRVDGRWVVSQLGWEFAPGYRP